MYNKGANLNNYITFNNEEYRIVLVELDETLKIIKNGRLDNTMAWDASNSRDWTRLATLNTYLTTTYYNTLSEESKEKIDNHTWCRLYDKLLIKDSVNKWYILSFLFKLLVFWANKKGKTCQNIDILLLTIALFLIYNGKVRDKFSII